MGRILEAFSEGRLCADEKEENRSAAYQRLCERSFRLHDELEEKLGDEEKALLEGLMDSLLDESSSDSQHSFIRGYRLGVLMTMEVFMGEDELIME